MGAPKGNRNGAHDKPWTRALARHVAQNPDKLARLAKKTFELALDGDIQALREIGDRLDGKPVQSIAGHDGGEFQFNHNVDLTGLSEAALAELSRIAEALSSGDPEGS